MAVLNLNNVKRETVTQIAFPLGGKKQSTLLEEYRADEMELEVEDVSSEKCRKSITREIKQPALHRISPLSGTEIYPHLKARN